MHGCSDWAHLPHKPSCEESVGVLPGIHLGALSIDEYEGQEEKVRYPCLQAWRVCSEEHIVLEPGHIRAHYHDCERDKDAIEGDTIVHHSWVLENGNAAGLAEPDVPELAHDQCDVPCRIGLHMHSP
jgi:hypothetical protein